MDDSNWQVGYSVSSKNKVVGLVFFFLSEAVLDPAGVLNIPLEEEVNGLGCFHTFSPPL